MDLKEMDDPGRRLEWLRARGRSDAQATIDHLGRFRGKYSDWRELPREEQDAYIGAYDECLYEYNVAERKAGRAPRFYQGPLTERDSWRGMTVVKRADPGPSVGDPAALEGE